jgi:OOP family OmpA-OmpF porin
MKKTIRSALLAAAIVAALPALAQSGPAYAPWYIGAGIGRGNINVSGTDLTGLNNATVDDTSNTYSARLGWRFSPYMAVELGYYDLGKFQFAGQQTAGGLDTSGEAKAKSWGLSFVGILPIDAFDLYGRIGYARSEVKLNASGPLSLTSYNQDDTRDEATYGVGARWNFSRNWAMFAEWVKNDDIQVDSYLFGFDFKF